MNSLMQYGLLRGSLLMLFLTLFLSLSATAQVSISGQIEGTNTSFRIYEFLTDASYTIPINEDGSFEITFDMNYPAKLWGRYGEMNLSIFVKPQTKLSIYIDEKQEKVVFSEDLAPENNFLWAQKEKIISPDLLLSSLNLSPEAYWQKVKESYHWYQEYDEDYQSKITDFDPVFVDLEQKSQPYMLVNRALIPVLNYLTRYNRNENENRKRIMDMGIDDYLKKVELDQPELLNVPAYASFLQHYLRYLTFKTGNQPEPSLGEGYKKVLKAQLKTLKKSNLQSPEVKGHLAAALLVNHLRTYRLNDHEPLLEYYQQQQVDALSQKKVERVMATIDAMSPGNTIKNYQLKDLDDNMVETKDYRGKYLLINFVYYPCTRECENEEKLLEELKIPENMSVLHLLVNSQPEGHMLLIRKKAKFMGRDYALTLEGYQDPILEDFLVTPGIRYILIDPEGKIIDADIKPSGDLKKQMRKMRKQVKQKRG